MKRCILIMAMACCLLLTLIHSAMAESLWTGELELNGYREFLESCFIDTRLNYQTDNGWILKDISLGYSKKDLTVKIGQNALNWGPGEESLILNDDQGFPMLYIAKEWNIFKIPIHWEQFWADLHPRAGETRKLFGHRYMIEAGNLVMGASETVVLSGDYSEWFNVPFIPYYAVQHYQKGSFNRNSNILMQIDADWKLNNGHRYYAALMFDDASGWPPDNHVPGRVGVQMGLNTPGIIADWGVKAEYTGISRYTYTYLTEVGDYIGSDTLIGHPLGPDAERTRVEFFRPLNDWELAVRLDYERHGEGRFGDRWSSGDGGGYHFLNSVTETTQRLGLRFEGPWRSKTSLSVLIGYEWVDNLNNHTNVSRNDFYGELLMKLVW